MTKPINPIFHRDHMWKCIPCMGYYLRRVLVDGPRKQGRGRPGLWWFARKVGRRPRRAR